MNTRRGFIHGLLVSLFLSLAACSGGGDGQVAGGGTGGTGSTVAVSRGPIEATTTSSKALQGVTAAPTISVNGVSYDVSNATITGTETVVPGMIVTVKGEIDATGRATANSVDYSRSLVGRMSGFAAGGKTFAVYGQNVVVDNLTKFDPDGGAWLANDLWVEVSGFVLDGGVVRATFVKQLSEQSAVEIEGFVTAVDSGLRTLQVGGATVSVPVGVGPEFSQFAIGSYVEIHAEPLVGGSTALTANEISIEDTSLGGEAGDEADVEGLITFINGSTFVVAGQQVTFDANTAFSGGADTDLAPGIKVEVEGAINVSGTLVAEEIKFEDSIEITDTVSVSPGDDTFTFALGIGVQLDPELTEGYAEANYDVNQVVRIRGRTVNGSLLATKIESVDSNAEVDLQGPVSEITPSTSFKILGVVVNASDLSTFEVNDSEVPAATFFSQLKAGDLVEVIGTRTAPATVDWTAAELE